ncbi:MAG: ABC-2 family transporter protein [Clostridia bacterium]|nr:ABC-2 family transporter protein [Clostridia bacterium]
MRRYLIFIKSSFMASAVYRAHFYFTAAGNILYIAIIYFLWKAIFENSGEVMNGMDFNQVIVYLTLATSLYSLFLTWTEWDISSNVINGNIVMDLIKPIDLQIRYLFDKLGVMIVNFIIIVVPSLLVILFVLQAKIPVGINLAFFFISVLLAFFISFQFDYFVGLISFYTESIWGISATKEMTVLFFSGAVIPVNFFPPILKEIAMLLPFQAVYNVPLTMVTAKGLELMDYMGLLAIQGFWVLALFAICQLFYRKAIKVITVNGG